MTGYEWQFLDWLAYFGWTIVSVTVPIAVIGLLTWIVVELWNMPEPGPRKDDRSDERQS